MFETVVFNNTKDTSPACLHGFLLGRGHIDYPLEASQVLLLSRLQVGMVIT